MLFTFVFYKMTKITAMEEKRKKMRKSVAEFYAANRRPPSESALVIFDKNHVQNAMARFNQTDFVNKAEKKKAYNKVLRAAHKFEIDVEEFKNLGGF